MSDAFEVIIPNFVDENDKPLTPLNMGFTDVPDGFYKVLINAMGKHKSQKADGKDTALFDVTITEDGPCQGLQTSIFAGIDFSKPATKRRWLAILDSVGLTADRIPWKAGAKLNAATFVGKTAYIGVRNPPAGEAVKEGEKKPMADRNFVTRDYYAQMKSQAPAKPAGATATGPQGPTTLTPQTQQPPANGTSAGPSALDF